MGCTCYQCRQAETIYQLETKLTELTRELVQLKADCQDMMRQDVSGLNVTSTVRNRIDKMLENV